MKTNKLVRFVVLFLAIFCLSSSPLRAMMFYFDTYVIADVGNGSYFFDALSDGPNTNWNGANFSYNLLGGTLTLKGGEVKAFRDDGGNFWNENNTQTVNYAVFTNGGTPSFSQFQILANGSGGTVGFISGNDFGATNSTGNIDLGSSITDSGSNWRIAVNFSGNGSFNSGGQQFFDMATDNNGGANYVANVSAFYGATTTATQSVVFEGTGFFNFNGSGQTFTLDEANTYTGETQIDAGTVALSGSLNSSSMIFLGSGGNASDAALSLSGTTTLANNMQVNVSSGSGARDFIKADATSQIASGNITNNRNSTINVAEAGGNLNLSGVLSGGSAMEKTGAGTLVLSGSSANTMSGLLTVGAGEVVLSKAANTSALGGAVTVASDATLRTTEANQFGNNLATVNGTLNLAENSQSLALRGSGTVSLGAATLTNNVGGSDTFAGKITGTGNLVKTGTGTAFLSGSSDYTGTTTVSSGILEVQNANALGTSAGGTTVADTATLKIFNAGAMTVADTIVINGVGDNNQGALRSVGGSNTVSGAVTLGANSRIGATGGNLTLSGGVAGGSHVLFVGGANNTLISSVISGDGNDESGSTTSLFKDGAGALTLSGNNNYTGDTRITAGAVTVATGGNLGNGTSDVFISSGATLNINANSQVASLRETGTGNGGVAAIGSGATLTVSGNAYNGFMNSISGEGNLIKSGTGTMNLYGVQNYSGTTTVSGGRLSSAVGMDSSAITVSGGTFETTAANVVGNTTAVTVNGGTYSVGGSDSIGAISGSGGTIDITNGTLTTSFNAATSAYSGAVTGTGGLTKAGTGTLTLAGNNTKSGANTVSAGTLVVNGQLAGSTTVEGGATLAGSGSVGATTIASGGTINPGDSPGTLTLTNGLTFSSGGNYNWQIFNADDGLAPGLTNTWDLIAVTGGDWDISGLSSVNQFNINLWSLSGISPDVNGDAINFNNALDSSWEILTYTSLVGTFNSDLFVINSSAFNGTSGFSNDLNGGTFSLEADATSLYLLFTASGGPGPEPIPEPGTWAAAALLAGAAGYVRWRRRRIQKSDA